ncbi:MAG TPA: HAD family hydrolase, partial [Thermomicrobiales bacterium]|nr:HAD family hydrolase [Thermomicrobiales bacterium]
MPIEAMTLDFHDTIARCDDWFALEVRDLAPAALRLLAAAGHAPDDAALRDRARAAYRELRLAIIGHGEERDALSCALAALAAVGVAPPEEAVAGAVERLMRDALAGASPVRGVIAAVRALRRRGLRLGVVSSAVYHPFLDWTLARFGLRDAFASVVTSASCGFYKSRPEIYHT